MVFHLWLVGSQSCVQQLEHFHAVLCEVNEDAAVATGSNSNDILGETKHSGYVGGYKERIFELWDLCILVKFEVYKNFYTLHLHPLERSKMFVTPRNIHPIRASYFDEQRRSRFICMSVPQSISNCHHSSGRDSGLIFTKVHMLSGQEYDMFA